MTEAILKMDGTKKSCRSLDIIQKVLVELQREGTNKILLAILENLYNIYKYSRDINVQKIDMAIMFLKVLENCTMENYIDVFNDLDKCFLSKELRKVTVKSSKISEILVLGQGDSGVVLLGQLDKSFVAVKKAKYENSGTVLLQEAKILARLDHKNVVKLVAFQKKPSMIVMEHVQMGNLKLVVQSGQMGGRDLLKAIYDVATGMVHVAGKNIIHRDLDSINIFVDSNKVCKIGDFGLARYVGHSPNLEYKEKGHMEIMIFASPETFINRVYSKKTDVWAFGLFVLVLYDIAGNSSYSNDLYQLKSLLTAVFTKGMFGFPRPNPCPVDLHKFLLEEIFRTDPRQRSDFPAIKEKIGKMLFTKSK